MSGIIRRPQTFRRKKATKIMVDGDLDSAEAVTYTPIAELQNDGTTVIKHVLERLDVNTVPSMAGQSRTDPLPPINDYNNDQEEDMPASPPPNTGPRKRRVSIHTKYIIIHLNDFSVDPKRLYFGVCIAY